MRRSRRGSIASALLILLALVLVVGLVFYLFYYRTGEMARIESTQAREAWDTVKDASRNAVTTSKVKTALALSKNLSASDINVDSRDGVVTLRGQVPSQEARRLAEQIARDTEGVTNVNNQLSVVDSEQATVQRGSGDYERQPAVRREAQQGDQTADDLAKRVEFELYSSGAFDLDPINVRSSDRIVILEGQVRSNAEKILAEKLAKEVEGVETVRNNLRVAPGIPSPTMEPQPTE
ncbi:MAG TPA: BON domain-containing protein [Acidobacteriota bacterium]|jgi:osmotically-inducible protein OsmY|nr:BON domain-containing protein [Acidobacteriota bacterium]